MREHATTLRGDGGKKPELFQARCTCGWETGYVLKVSAETRAKFHRKNHSNK